jgi:hypothetical protein
MKKIQLALLIIFIIVFLATVYKSNIEFQKQIEIERKAYK